jgi:uncharacterized membrane protein (DUF4010 family)
LIVASLSGLVDVDAAVISIARLSGKDIDLNTAAHGILIAAAANTISKAALAGWVGGGRVGIFVGGSSVVALAAGFVAFAW